MNSISKLYIIDGDDTGNEGERKILTQPMEVTDKTIFNMDGFQDGPFQSIKINGKIAKIEKFDAQIRQIFGADVDYSSDARTICNDYYGDSLQEVKQFHQVVKSAGCRSLFSSLGR